MIELTVCAEEGIAAAHAKRIPLPVSHGRTDQKSWRPSDARNWRSWSRRLTCILNLEDAWIEPAGDEATLQNPLDSLRPLLVRYLPCPS